MFSIQYNHFNRIEFWKVKTYPFPKKTSYNISKFQLALKPKLTDISKVDKNKQKDTEKGQKEKEQKEKEQKQKEQKQKEHKDKEEKEKKQKQKSLDQKTEKTSSSHSEPEQTDSILDFDNKSDDFYDNLKKNLDNSIKYSKKYNIDDDIG
jgi:cell division protein FtsN